MAEIIGTRQQAEYIEKIVCINRVSKVTKGMKRLSFSALVVVGDTQGNVGIALGKAREVAEAIRKGLSKARRDLISVPVYGTTISHKIIGKFGAAQVLLKPASEGTGIIAAGPVRAICEAAGIKDILTKCLKSNNPINVVKATMQGLTNLKP
ncbi:MAG: 30S ribosomal protein S5 [Candidatus Omnitrophota bacterium]